MATVAASNKAQFIISCGDNFYDTGVKSIEDPHWQESFETVYQAPSLQIPWYVTLGNHDYGGNIDAQIAYHQHSPRWTLPARYYAIEQPLDDYSSTLFVYLDTTPFLKRYYPDGPESLAHVMDQDTDQQIRWLEATLAESSAPWKIVVGHHPLYSASPFHGDSLELQETVLPLLKRYGVALYCCGHEHDLQHLMVDGLHQILSGSAADSRVTGADERTCFSSSLPGFASVSLNSTQCKWYFHDAQGKILYQARVRSFFNPES
jgi:acid phosphatase